MSINSKIFNYNTLVTSPTLWLKSDKGITLDSSGNVEEWQDQSGNNYHMTQSNAANRPAYLYNKINYKPTLQFNGTAAYMTNSFGQDLSQPNTFFAVWKVDLEDDIVSIQMLIDGISSTKRNMFYMLDNKCYMLAGNNVVVYNKSLPFSYILHTVYFNNASSKVYENSILQNSNLNVGSQPISGLTIGANQSRANKLYGSICEIIMYNTLINETERISIENYLKMKYGL